MSSFAIQQVNRVLCLAVMAAVLAPINACREDVPLAPLRQIPQRGSRQAVSQPTFPLKVSANHRYLVDQHDVPFLAVGDSPHLLFMSVSVADAATYFQARQAEGFNIIYAQLVSFDGMNVPTYDGIAPFLTPGDPSTPNP